MTEIIKIDELLTPDNEASAQRERDRIALKKTRRIFIKRINECDILMKENKSIWRRRKKENR